VSAPWGREQGRSGAGMKEREWAGCVAGG
jgi:hypothetical protein